MAAIRRAVLVGAPAAVLGALAGRAAAQPTLVPWPTPVRRAVPVVAAADGALLGALAGRAVDAVLPGGRRADARVGSPAPAGGSRRPYARAAVLTALGIAGVAAARMAADRALAGMTAQGRDLDPGFAAPPSDETVSGGPGSLVPYATTGREGARYVSTLVPPHEIAGVTGEPPVATPVRVFVGVDAAATPEERVALAIAELKRTGGFERAHLLVQSPAGSGYSNPTPVDVLEVLTRGDTAAVSVGYGLLPSFLSLNKKQVAETTNRLLLEAIRCEVRELPEGKRPRILAYGESLGAGVQEAALASGVPDLDRYSIDAALWVGTPGGKSADRFHAAVREVATKVDRPEQVPAAVRDPYPRVWFLEHDGDPVVRFRPDLLWRRPGWLAKGEPRGRNVPPGMTWFPGVTWLTTLVDTLFATHVRPGDFQSLGHDYRADLGAVVTAAFRLPASEPVAQRLEEFLRRTEVARAARIDGSPSTDAALPGT